VALLAGAAPTVDTCCYAAGLTGWVAYSDRPTAMIELAAATRTHRQRSTCNCASTRDLAGSAQRLETADIFYAAAPESATVPLGIRAAGRVVAVTVRHPLRAQLHYE
jgi:hypothetical protein